MRSAQAVHARATAASAARGRRKDQRERAAVTRVRLREVRATRRYWGRAAGVSNPGPRRVPSGVTQITPRGARATQSLPGCLQGLRPPSARRPLQHPAAIRAAPRHPRHTGVPPHTQIRHTTDASKPRRGTPAGAKEVRNPWLARYLQAAYEAPRLTVSAKLQFLDFVEEIARERGQPVPTAVLEHLRGLVREGAL